MSKIITKEKNRILEYQGCEEGYHILREGNKWTPIGHQRGKWDWYQISITSAELHDLLREIGLNTPEVA